MSFVPLSSSRTLHPPRPPRLPRAISTPLRALAWVLACGSALAPTSPLHAQSAEPSRGQLLYQTHCIACHNSQMHWRDQRLVRDWPGLLAQVRGWQARANLEWSDADITEVARHLNDSIYRLERPVAQAPQRAPRARSDS